MPIPFLFIGIGAASALFGAGKTIKAGLDQKDAKETNASADWIVEKATNATNIYRENSGKAITRLGEKKIWILDNSVKPFITIFEKIHDIELTESKGLTELHNIKIDKQSFESLKKMQSMASSLAQGMAGGAVMGAVTAFGAYGSVMTFATASTGTAISALSGAAATNATLAFLGGGSLATGGLGMAGGSAVLGGLVAGPALAVLGLVVGAKAKANRDEAYSNLAKAREFAENMKSVRTMCRGIRMRATMFERLLIQLDGIFVPLVKELENIVNTSGTNYQAYSDSEKKVVAQVLSLAGAIKSVLDTPILTKEGNLTKESENIAAKTKYYILEQKGENYEEETGKKNYNIQEADQLFNLGEKYYLGRGVSVNEAKAVECYIKAADLGSVKAQYKLGVCYEFGRGVDKDASKSVFWYTRAAEQYYPDAQYKLGVCYFLGNGVGKDEQKAKELLSIAANQGCKAAKEWLD